MKRLRTNYALVSVLDPDNGTAYGSRHCPGHYQIYSGIDEHV